jgi:hypothetical protein
VVHICASNLKFGMNEDPHDARQRARDSDLLRAHQRHVVQSENSGTHCWKGRYEIRGAGQQNAYECVGGDAIALEHLSEKFDHDFTHFTGIVSGQARGTADPTQSHVFLPSQVNRDAA